MSQFKKQLVYREYIVYKDMNRPLFFLSTFGTIFLYHIACITDYKDNTIKLLANNNHLDSLSSKYIYVKI